MTLEELRQKNREAIANDTRLSNLSSSTMSVLFIISDCIAFVLYMFYADHEAFKEEVEDYIGSQKLGSEAWYYDKCLEFQLGDELFVDRSTYQVSYSQVNEDKQIIKFASVREIIRLEVTVLLIQVSKEGKKPLSEIELDAFRSYMGRVSFAGIQLQLESKLPNPLTINVAITTNPELINLEGQSLAETTIYPVREAVASYIDNITYGGTFNKTACIDAMQKVAGVEDAIITLLSVDGVDIEGQSITASSGAFNLVEMVDTYIPKI